MKYSSATALAATAMLASALTGLTGASASSAPVSCVQPGALIVGGPGNDVLIGTPFNDTIVGRGGNDTIRGRGGADEIRSGAGADEVFGGACPDEIRLGDGNDQGRGDGGCPGEHGPEVAHGVPLVALTWSAAAGGNPLIWQTCGIPRWFSLNEQDGRCGLLTPEP